MCVFVVLHYEVRMYYVLFGSILPFLLSLVEFVA